MAQTIKLKRSSVSGNTPSTSDLELGEVAINTYDGKMFIKKNDGSDSIVEIGGTSGTVTEAFKTIAVSGQSSVVADSDVRNNNQPSATTDVYGAQANEDIELVSSALAITQSELAIDTTQYNWYEKQQAKLQSDYEKGLQALVRA